MVRCLFITNSRDPDGAQRQLECVVGLSFNSLILTLKPFGVTDSSNKPYSLIEVVKWMKGGISSKNEKVILVGWMYHANIIAGLMGILLRLPFVMAIHHDFLISELPGKGLKFRASLRLNRFLSSWASAITFPSRISLTTHVRYGFNRGRLFVIRNSLDPRFSKSKIQNRRFGVRGKVIRLLVVGRCHDDKGRTILHRLVQYITANPSDIRLDIVGRGYDWMGPPQLSSESPIKYLGHQEMDAELYQRYDRLLVLSKAEAFGLTLLEAASSSVKFISFRVGIAPVLERFGFGVTTDATFEALLQEIHNIDIEDGDEQIHVHKIAELRKRFSLEAQQYKYSKLLKSI